MAGKGKKNAPVSLECMKAGYKDAKSNGDAEEEARWANQIGHAYKDKGEYVHALKWFRIDYEISSRRKEAGHVSATDLMPTCQSMGEIYLRLQDYDEALVYQERHYRLAQEANDLVEQQRASTQLGRTYLELYENQDNFSALQTAKDFFKIAMDLARRLKANPPYRDSPSYVKELVDAYNNMGLLKMASDDLQQARNLFLQGLRICDEEELGGNDDARSRIHHNLGRLFSDQRDWIQAKEHTLKDISICQKIPHPQGEAKGFINLGEMHFKSQNYEDAMLCFSRALKIAETLEDEDSLANTAKDNMNVVREAKLTMAEFHAGEQKLKKLQRVVESSRGSPAERSRLLQEHKALQELIGQAEELQAWEKHLELAKRAKKVVHQLGDSEKLGDAFGTIGCSYENLKFFDKAKKWHLKSWDLCRRVKHLEGQSVAKINYGNALDNNGEWDCALQAYKEAYQIASSQGKTKMLAQQISALENMQYSYYVRLDHVQDGRDVQAKLKKLKELKDILEREPIAEDEHCSETEDEDEDNHFSQDASDHLQVHVPQTSLLGDAHISQSISNCNDQSNESDELCTSSDALYQKENILKSTCGRQHLSAGQCDGAAAGSFGLEVEKKSRKKGQGQEALPGGGIKEQQSNKKRHRVILSDDEDNEAIFLASQVDYLTSGQQADNQVMEHDGAIELDDSTSNVQAASSNFPESKLTGKKAQSSMRDGIRNIHEIMSSESEGEDWLSKTPNFLHKKRKENNNGQTKDEALPVNPGVSEEDCMHHNTLIHEQQFQAPVSYTAVLQENVTSSVSNKEVLPCGLPDMQPSPLEKVLATLPVSVGGQLIRVPCKGSNVDQLNSRTVDWLMEEVRSLYGKVMPAGPHPILEGMRFKGIMLNPMDLLSDLLAESNAENKVEAIIKGWIILPLVERYKVHCIKCRCVPNVKLIEKLERYQGSDDEVDASGCELDEGSIWPLMLALRDSETLSVINLSHNHLGSPTMNAIQELVSAHNLKDLGLKLDLHENKLGAGALTKICRCDVTLSRLEVLVLSKNRLGDAAARHVALILQQCSALVTLELEDCGLTTRTIQAIATALQSSSPLVKLAIGKNNPIAGSALQLLLQKLSTLCRYVSSLLFSLLAVCPNFCLLTIVVIFQLHRLRHIKRGTQ
ncbi:hypothetical protein O6H91_08G100700 [Diphasiastrum complanatum]|uniref:Uncharacterized protein n=1 Tax=Diphasiastrum complanatum TaxID=34168 RepID=A0ACC2D0G3_DIPCM|nr:hypothetical protein O6H91_08G100700 [Diphasiastrum complanatum]